MSLQQEPINLRSVKSKKETKKPKKKRHFLANLGEAIRNYRLPEKFKRDLFWIIVLAIAIVATYTYRGMQDEIQKLKENLGFHQAIHSEVRKVMSFYKFNSTNPQLEAEIVHNGFIDPVLVAEIIAIESEGDGEAVSPAGALGYMQIMPDKLHGANWRDMRTNIRIGAKYYKTQLDRFGSIKLALAAFNAGPESIKNNQIPPIVETQGYIKKYEQIDKLVKSVKS